MPEEVLTKLSANLRGSVITPASSEYEIARKVCNGMIDRRPDAIVRCANVADVRAAVNFARQEGLTDDHVEVKRKYDPTNFLNVNQNINPN